MGFHNLFITKSSEAWQLLLKNVMLVTMYSFRHTLRKSFVACFTNKRFFILFFGEILITRSINSFAGQFLQFIFKLVLSAGRVSLSILWLSTLDNNSFYCKSLEKKVSFCLFTYNGRSFFSQCLCMVSSERCESY